MNKNSVILPRHQKYVDVSVFAHEKESAVHKKIADFVLNDDLSPDNEDDLEIFIYLVWDSSPSRLHIDFFDRILGTTDTRNFQHNLKIIGRYLNYLSKKSIFSVYDFFVFLYTDMYIDDVPLGEVIDELFPYLCADVKRAAIVEAENHPKALKESNKLRIYNLFS